MVGTGSTLGGNEPVISDAVRREGLVFLSGRAPVDPATLALVSDDFEEQLRAVLRDVSGVLAISGSSLEHVVRVECFLADAGDFEALNRIWNEVFSPPRPARTTIVCGFTVPGMRVELQVTAAQSSHE